MHTNQNMLQIRIFNLSGQLVSSKKLNAQEYQYDLNGIDAGVYIIAVETTNGNFKERLVLKK
ncbi:MAG: hypothetical protein B7C24_11300 [Bacteroidetes bacterium 4572_77]|nr:MAG: hypothetical protein B7C24_11300 [Bacteroidetes bacterium 4572_77]